MVLMPQLHDFCNAYPEIRLELTSNSKPIDLLKEGVDVVLRVGALEEAMVARRIGWLRLALYRVADLFAPLRHAPGSYGAGAAQGGESSVEPHRTMCDAVVARSRRRTRRNTWGRDPAPHVDSGRIAEIMSGWQSDPIPISAMYPQNRHLSAKVRGVCELGCDVYFPGIRISVPRRRKLAA